MAGELHYHYTSVKALFTIVKCKRFRLSNILFMNDSLEFKWLWRLVQEEIEKRHRDNSNDKSNRYLYHLQSQMERLLGWNTEPNGGIVPNVFCGCFSTRENDLNQWRHYADDGRGVVIGVKLPSVILANCDVNKPDAPKPKAVPVNYSRDEQSDWATKTLDQFVSLAASFDVETAASEDRESNIIQTSLGCCMELARNAPICKNEAFESEHEVRLIVASPPHTGFVRDFKIDPLPKDVDYYFQKGRVVPCVYLTFPAEVIGSITLGPTFGGTLEKSALQSFLLKHGVQKQVVREIKRSDLSYHGRASQG